MVKKDELSIETVGGLKTDKEAEYIQQAADIISNAMIMHSNNKISTTRASIVESKYLYPTHYYQNNQYWSNDNMETLDETIGNSGCLLTSFTMLEDYLKGNSDTPRDVNNTLGDYACLFYWYQAASEYGLTVDYLGYPTKTTAYSIVISNIKNYNRPVIVGVDNGISTHYVLARGYSIDSAGNETMYIYDPAYQRDYSTLTEYENAGYYYGTARVGVYE